MKLIKTLFLGSLITIGVMSSSYAKNTNETVKNETITNATLTLVTVTNSPRINGAPLDNIELSKALNDSKSIEDALSVYGKVNKIESISISNIYPSTETTYIKTNEVPYVQQVTAENGTDKKITSILKVGQNIKISVLPIKDKKDSWLVSLDYESSQLDDLKSTNSVDNYSVSRIRNVSRFSVDNAKMYVIQNLSTINRVDNKDSTLSFIIFQLEKSK